VLPGRCDSRVAARPRRLKEDKEFKVLKRRWIVERTFA
jgi:hypothetical protein